jgi:hypothetical protein
VERRIIAHVFSPAHVRVGKGAAPSSDEWYIFLCLYIREDEIIDHRDVKLLLRLIEPARQ